MNGEEANTPKVSIVIPFYNDPYIDQAIESALNQTHPNVEILVVNDGSSQHLEKIAPYRDRIRYFEKENGGTASALNMGIQHATGDYFCWLSSDDLYVPDKVEKQVAFLKKMMADVCFSAFVYIDAHNRVLSGSIGTDFSNKLQFYETLRQWCPINGCTIMMKMNVFGNVGLFNEMLPYANDYDFWLRVLPCYDFIYMNEPLVKYRVHAEMGTKKYDRVILKEIFIIQQKHHAVLEALMEKEKQR